MRRLLSDDYADKVIVTTIQKLGLALDENSKRNKQHKEKGKATYKERLEPLRDKRMVFIFDECHRSQFGENHKTIKEFFPKAQLFGFTGTPIFEENASYQADRRRRRHASRPPRTSSRSNCTPTPSPTPSRTVTSCASTSTTSSPKRRTTPPKARRDRSAKAAAVVDAILDKHDAATGQRRFNALLATASINDAIEYHDCSSRSRPSGRPPIPTSARSRSPASSRRPPKATRTCKQLQEDLPQEKADNQQEPEEKKARSRRSSPTTTPATAPTTTSASSTSTTRTCRSASRTSNTPTATCPHKGAEKIDITIVVDMLLTGFDSKYLNTLYVDKNLKHHGLIQAFSRTNRVLNDTKPYGNILDFREQQDSGR